ncbi:hypothetical protein V6N11_070346 [Hibiscus sabdariffa]|uniref:TFIIS N-terminal domain-containing protein n=1 Tax=Hibiscus sabdariffa TaxID=183260 RepID=A0ABR2QF50_9ROSI
MVVATEEDAELNRQNKPTIMMLPLLTDILSKKHLEQEFLDSGVLSLFKNWLERPDGSLPNAIDISSEDPREKLKRSKIGKVIMFMSKSEEKTTSNRQLTKDLVENCCRTIFNKNARGLDLKNKKEEVVIPLKKQSAMKVKEVDLALESRPKQSSYQQQAVQGRVFRCLNQHTW